MVGLFIYYDEEDSSDTVRTQAELYTFATVEEAIIRFKWFINGWLDDIAEEDIDREQVINKAISSYSFDCSEYCDWLYNYAKLDILLPGNVY